jgi:hypothetical protein
MSTGRFILRGWAFQGRIYAPWALGNGGAVVITAPVAGWTANKQQRHWIAQTQQRYIIASTQERLWTSEPKQ